MGGRLAPAATPAAWNPIPFMSHPEMLSRRARWAGEEPVITRLMAKALAHGLGAFFHIFIIKRGILDGWAGFVIALGNFEGTFYRYAKRAERDSGWDKPPDVNRE